MIMGRVIEVSQTTIKTGDSGFITVNRLWCIDAVTHDEICIHAEWYPPESGPKVGEPIWWQAESIHYDQDRKKVKKVGYSYKPKGAE